MIHPLLSVRSQQGSGKIVLEIRSLASGFAHDSPSENRRERGVLVVDTSIARA
jgi:hypothetical protein